MKCICGHGLAMHVHKPKPSVLHGLDRAASGPPATEPEVKWCRRTTCSCAVYRSANEGRVGYVEPKVNTDKPYTTVWTDGSSTGAWGVGGWGWAVIDGPLAGREGYGGHEWTTNQREELTAAHEAVKALPGLLLVVSDSQYVVRCFTEKWYVGWIRKDYRGVKNDDLWKPFIDDVLARNGEIKFEWVKGHQGMPGNERADVLAKRGKVEQDVPLDPDLPSR